MISLILTPRTLHCIYLHLMSHCDPRHSSWSQRIGLGAESGQPVPLPSPVHLCTSAPCVHVWQILNLLVTCLLHTCGSCGSCVWTLPWTSTATSHGSKFFPRFCVHESNRLWIAACSSLQHTSATATALAHRHAHALKVALQLSTSKNDIINYIIDCIIDSYYIYF